MQKFHVQVHDLERLVRRINSAAYVKAADMATSMQYEKFSDSAFANWMLAGITGEPGLATVQSDAKVIDNLRHNLAVKMVGQAISSAGQGVGSLETWIAGMEAERQRHSESLNRTYANVRAANDQVIGALTNAIRVAATVKVASTVIISVTPLGAGIAGVSATIVVQAGVVNFIYSVGKDLAKDLASDKSASVVAFDVGKNVVKEAVQHGAQRIEEKAAGRIPEIEKLMRLAQSRIDSLSGELARKVSSRKIAKLERQIGRVEGTLAAKTGELAKAKLIRTAGKAVPVVFAGWDVWEAIEEYREDMGWKQK